MIENIKDRVFQATAQRRTVYPCHANRASNLGHPCERHLVYWRTRYQDAALPSVTAQFIFDGGNMIETVAQNQLREAGFTLLHQQRPLDCPEFRELAITGHLDWMIQDNGGPLYPCEVKGLNQFDWEKIDKIEDLRDSSKPWLRKYPAQLNLYMLMTNTEEGVFYIVNKQSFQPKVIWAKLDYGYTEELLQKAARINAHVIGGTIPDRIEYDIACDMCPFSLICLPGKDYGPGIRMIDDEETIAQLERRTEIEAAAKEFKTLDDVLRKKFQDIPQAVCGDFSITGKLIQRKGFTVEPSQYWKTNIRKL